MTAVRKSTEVRDLQREAQAAKAIREALATFDDADLTRDTIEGETNLHESIAAVMAMVTEAEILEDGLKAKIAQLTDRKAAIQRRQDSLRTIISQAMAIADLRTLPLPEATLSLAATPPGLIVTDEARIPAKFWKQQDPTLDRKALNEALKAGDDIPGVTRSNGGVALKIRRA